MHYVESKKDHLANPRLARIDPEMLAPVPQRPAANSSQRDSRPRGPGQHPHSTGECRTRVQEIVRRGAEEVRYRVVS